MNIAMPRKSTEPSTILSVTRAALSSSADPSVEPSDEAAEVVESDLCDTTSSSADPPAEAAEILESELCADVPILSLQKKTSTPS